MAIITPLHSVACCSLVASCKNKGCNTSKPHISRLILYCCNLILKYRIKVYSTYIHIRIYAYTHVFCIFKYIILVLSKKLFFSCNVATYHRNTYIDADYSCCNLIFNPATK